MNTEASGRLLDRVRKLLAKAEDESVTPPEAQALTAKAAELMAKYGIDRALLAADRPETDQPASRMLDIDNPWAPGQGAPAVRARIGAALPVHHAVRRAAGQPDPRVRLRVRHRAHRPALHIGADPDVARPGGRPGSGLEQQPEGLAAQLAAGLRHRGDLQGPGRRARGRQPGDRPGRGRGSRTALVLADRAQVIRAKLEQEYPVTRTARVTYSGSGYGAGYAQGQRADIGAAASRGRAAAR